MMGMYLIKPSTRNHRSNAAIVTVDRIYRTCHLIPEYGAEINPIMPKHNALDVTSQFMIIRTSLLTCMHS
ncbi:hypothetical protein IEO21_02390 [Rhodonia placenta]|uniref:Uncharacterized protein n=1 Tax=Rhodonia placenta TaxID=104341 RepID=A0A8H7U4J2_9APHY|nr:hypothetical protein IEO21_02390 [Postia placenta]